MRRLQIKLFGAFSAQWNDGTTVVVKGDKPKVLIALLVTAKGGAHSKNWLQQTLWSAGDRDHGMASLRRALHDIRKALGVEGQALIDSPYGELRIDLSHIELIGDGRDGEFLEGIDIPEKGFRTWIAAQREHGVVAQKQNAESDYIYTSQTLMPTVAVLPLTVFGFEANQGFFGDLIAMELSRSLSRSKVINVISHLATRELAGSQISMSAVRETLRSDFIVYGFVRADQNGFVANVELADVTNGNVLWTRQLAADVDQILKPGSDFFTEVGIHIGYVLTNAAVELARSAPLPNLASHEIFLSAISNMHSDQLGAFASARRALEHLTEERGIKDARLFAWLAHWYMLSIPQGWTDNPAREVANALNCVSRALDINQNCSFSLAMSGMVNNSPGHDFTKASSLLAQARRLEANNALAWLLQGRLFAFAGDGKQAVAHADHALKLSPSGPQAYFFENIAATACVSNGEYDRAIALIDSSLAKNRHHRSSLRVKVVAHEMQGDVKSAKTTMQRLRALDPELTVKKYLMSHPAGDLPTGIEWAGSLARAGLPQ
ncbi:MAG: hypothetical protein WA921_13615 [Ahrensia sp.]